MIGNELVANRIHSLVRLSKYELSVSDRYCMEINEVLDGAGYCWRENKYVWFESVGLRFKTRQNCLEIETDLRKIIRCLHVVTDKDINVLLNNRVVKVRTAYSELALEIAHAKTSKR